MKISKEDILKAAADLAGAEPERVLEWALGRFGGKVAVASSFSIEDCTVIDMAARIMPVRVFALDTGRLPEETYRTAERVAQRYGIRIEWQFPERGSVEALEREKGLFSFTESLENRRECCRIRKVQPLGRALAGLEAWITGLRRQQSVTRAGIVEVEMDDEHGIVKLNPLTAWTQQQLETYAREHNVIMHPLHEAGYPSIGCAPCTRAVEAGQDPRAGRWWWEDPEHKECGLHPVRKSDQ